MKAPGAIPDLVASSSLDLETKDRERLCAADHPEPHRVLGAHPARVDGHNGVVVRAFHPDAMSAELFPSGEAARAMRGVGGGLFLAWLPDATMPFRYRLRFRFPDGRTEERDDPYRFLPTLGELDLHLFHEGTHRRTWEKLGAHVREVEGTTGVAFAVWAPNARRVSLVGDFCNWDGRLFPMRRIGASGVFELFVPGLKPGALYKYEIKTREGAIRVKSDPFALRMEGPPGHASIVEQTRFVWSDEAWMRSRAGHDPLREPLLVYEVHLGSWARVPEESHRFLTYRELAPRLVEHVKRLGFTHLELLPVAEHPLYDSWGYQVTGYFAPTGRYGTPDDFRFFVDYCHAHDVGVLLDWVPAHFPKDDFALRRFDGTALYEHDSPLLGEHPHWGTLVFNYGRHEVRSFLLANALYWLDAFHIDGLRVDAVASMLYLDYGRTGGEWTPNRWGGKENVDAIEFLRCVNQAVAEDFPGCLMVAEESTSWNGVTRRVEDHGLGFTFKWNMGWMNDTLGYFSREPIHRSYHHNELTFAMLYEHAERFINPLSHDEVVHGKCSLLEKMPGDRWQKFANLRTLLAYQYTRPGKKLLFMGTELAPYHEWDHTASLDWHLARDPERTGLRLFLEDLGRLYREHPCLWRGDPDPESFYWIDCQDAPHSVLSYVRQHDGRMLLVVLNLTPVPRAPYRIGAPRAGRYVHRMCSDHPLYGGSGYAVAHEVVTEPVPMHGHNQSLHLLLPPLAALVLEPVG